MPALKWIWIRFNYIKEMFKGLELVVKVKNTFLILKYYGCRGVARTDTPHVSQGKQGKCSQAICRENVLFSQCFQSSVFFMNLLLAGASH